MKKIVKGSIAAGAAGVLLLGGLSTMSYWSDSEDVDGGSVTAGTLSLGTPECDEGWVYADGNAGAGAAVALIVPGDTISKDCTFVITATGDNLTADLTTPTTIDVTGTPASTTFEANVTAGYTTAGVATGATITEANNGDTVTATIAVEFPFGDVDTINANDMQGIVAELDTIPITLTQTKS